MKLGENVTSYEEKFVFFRQSSTKYIQKSKKVQRNWTRPKQFDICF